MQKTPIPPVSPGPGYERIRNTLETILASEKFLSAPQMSAFLRYVVIQAATGKKSRIKAYTVAVDALGKPETFDPQNDPVVRVLAGRLRSTLSAYYEQHSDADVIIEMKPGSYVPTFILRESDNQPSDGSDTAGTRDDVTTAPQDGPVDSVDLAQAANNQWALNNADEPITDIRTPNYSYQQTAGDSAHSSSRPPSYYSNNGRFSSLIPNFRRFPKLTATAALLGALMIGMYADELMRSSEPSLLASKPSQDTSNAADIQRPRPDSLSLFFSATAAENSLASQVNTTMSSVFSETENIRVYRMLRPTQVQNFWPEDYHVSLNVLPLLDETQVSVQLVEAQTGRIAHSEILHLSAGALQGLNSEDLQTIMECSRRLIREDGPLTRDYKNKTERP